MRFSRESFLPWPVPSTPFVPFARVGILGDLLLLVVVANAAIDPLAVSCTGAFLPLPSASWSVSFDLAGFLSSAEPFLLPAFMSSAELFLLPVSDIPCFVGPVGFVNSFVDSAAIVLPALSLPSVELPSSTDVALFPGDIS